MSITKATNSGLVGTKYNNVSADNYYMEPIATTLVGSGGQATISFTNIPQGYKHLQLRWIWQASVTDRNITLQFNSDTSSSYAYHWLYGIGSGTPGSTSSTSQTAAHTGYQYAASGFNSAYFMGGVTDILDYSSILNNKTVRTLCGVDYNGSGRVQFDSGLWINTAPITSISIAVNGGGNLIQNSRFSLYGIRG
jgi:hypothetical protein